MQIHSLNGRWHLEGGQHRNLSITVPGTVHTALLEAGIIPDPYVGMQEADSIWIGDVTWTISRRFTLDEEMMAEKQVLLRCHGLDTITRIEVNNRYIGPTDNMFRTYEFDIKWWVRAGENNVLITFLAPVEFANYRLEERYLHNWGVTLDNDDDAHNNLIYKLPGGNYLRKAQYSFGWDWGPKVPTSGIWRDIEVVGFSEARIDNVAIEQTHSDGQVQLDVTTAVERLSAGLLTAHVQVLFEGELIAESTVDVGEETAVSTFTIPDPQLWWPNGLGDQPLYDVTVSLNTVAGNLLDTRSKRIGLRTLTLVTEADEWGESFHFAVNGMPFFAKGANWIPADSFLDWISDDDYERLIHDSALANMNMLRVWGGGIYEPDIFYDLCDVYGICVWQDFMFACATYPTFNKEWMETVRQEAIEQIKRLRHHASLALWCGNNELEQGLVGPEETEKTMSWEEYGRIFDTMLPELVNELDPQTSYWPGSPHTPVGDRHDFNNPNSGDAHIWDVWHGLEPFEFYRTCMHRFNSEFGFQSFPEPKTVAEFAPLAERNITSRVMEYHQRSLDGNARIMHYMLDWFRFPATHESVLWLSQIQQGMAIKYAVEHWRRTMPRGMGTLYWQLNDCWPVASWSSIDYYGRWKALHYMARRFYKPVLISGLDDWDNNTVEIHLTNDTRESLKGDVTWKLMTTTGDRVMQDYIPCIITPLVNNHIITLDFNDALSRNSRHDLLLYLDFEVDGVSLSTDLVLFCRPKHLNLVRPILDVWFKETDGIKTAVITTDKPTLWVWLSSDALDIRFSDNFFHLMPHQVVEVDMVLADDVSLEELETAVLVQSLIDTYQPSHPLRYH